MHFQPPFPCWAFQEAKELRPKKVKEPKYHRASPELLKECKQIHKASVCDFWNLVGAVDKYVTLPPSRSPSGAPAEKGAAVATNHHHRKHKNTYNQQPTVAVSIAVYGPGELILDQVANVLRYTLSDTAIVLHLSSRDSYFGATNLTACVNDLAGHRRIVVTPASLFTSWGSPLILLAHVLNFSTLLSLGMLPKYFALMARNSRLFRPGLECIVASIKMSRRGVPLVPLNETRNHWINMVPRDQLQCLFRASTPDDIHVRVSYHEGSFYPSTVLSSFLEHLTLIKRTCLFEAPYSIEEWLLQSYAGRKQFENLNAAEDDWKSMDYNAVSQPNYNFIKFDRHRLWPGCSNLAEILQTNKTLAYDFLRSCQRVYNVTRVQEDYGLGGRYDIGAKRVGDHMGDYALPMMNAAPPVPRNATLKHSCSKSRWVGSHLTSEQFKSNMDAAFRTYLQRIAAHDQDACIPEDWFFHPKETIMPAVHSSRRELPGSCERILSSSVTPSTRRTILRDTPSCRNSSAWSQPAYVFPPQKRKRRETRPPIGDGLHFDWHF